MKKTVQSEVVSCDICGEPTGNYGGVGGTCCVCKGDYCAVHMRIVAFWQGDVTGYGKKFRRFRICTKDMEEAQEAFAKIEGSEIDR